VCHPRSSPDLPLLPSRAAVTPLLVAFRLHGWCRVGCRGVVYGAISRQQAVWRRFWGHHWWHGATADHWGV